MRACLFWGAVFSTTPPRFTPNAPVLPSFTGKANKKMHRTTIFGLQCARSFGILCGHFSAETGVCS
jgi:hypothetical protein